MKSVFLLNYSGNRAFQTQPVPRPRLRLQPDPVSRGEEAGEGEADQEGGGEVKKKAHPT